MKVPTMEVPADAADVFARAADELESNGWCRNDFMRGDRHCAVGALAQATGAGIMQDSFGQYDIVDRWTVAPYVKAAERFLTESGKTGYYEELAEWNDLQTSKRPVVRLFRTLAEQFRQGVR
jgi:hypothetical protein